MNNNNNNKKKNYIVTIIIIIIVLLLIIIIIKQHLAHAASAHGSCSTTVQISWIENLSATPSDTTTTKFCDAAQSS